MANNGGEQGFVPHPPSVPRSSSNSHVPHPPTSTSGGVESEGGPRSKIVSHQLFKPPVPSLPFEGVNNNGPASARQNSARRPYPVGRVTQQVSAESVTKVDENSTTQVSRLNMQWTNSSAAANLPPREKVINGPASARGPQTSTPSSSHAHPQTARGDAPAPQPAAPKAPASSSQPASTNSTLPLTPQAALKQHLSLLTLYEQAEILEYPQVWYVGSASKTRLNPSLTNNHGFDDERGDYKIILHDQIAYRYEVVSMLGKGSFGQVCKVYDYKHNTLLACKLIRNKKRFHQQALVEVKLLQHLKDHDRDDTANIIHLHEFFYFRNHLCITFELMCINLYEFIKSNNYQGLSLSLIRRFAIQMLVCLRQLRKHRIIHCDLKPENVLLKQPNKSGIKVIDFGSSCFEHERVYTYIQSRFYRSPEVILGLPYDTAIDIWSFGCILAELYTGYPLFAGENEVEQLACIMEVFGVPPKHLIDMSKRQKMFFDSNGNPRIVPNSKGKKRRPGAKDLVSSLKCNDAQFIHFLQGCLKWDFRERLTADAALQHEWLVECAPPPLTHRRPSSSASTQSKASFGSRTPFSSGFFSGQGSQPRKAQLPPLFC